MPPLEFCPWTAREGADVFGCALPPGHKGSHEPRAIAGPAVAAAIAADEVREGVIFILRPPESLRNATREQIRAVITSPLNLGPLIEEVVETIYRSFTSDAPATSALLNLQDALGRAVEQRRRRGEGGG